MYPLAAAANQPEQRFVDGRDIVVPTLPHYTIAALEDRSVVAMISFLFPK